VDTQSHCIIVNTYILYFNLPDCFKIYSAYPYIVNKAVHYAQVLNSLCQEDITRNNKAEYHYCTGTTTVAPGYALYIYDKDN
jgi:hypothetical protein